MKIKKSDIQAVIQWIDVQMDRDPHFPFSPDDAEKAAKKHLKALKAWRKCTSSAKDVREWCEDWLDDSYRSQLEIAVEVARNHKADQPLNLTQEAYDKLLSEAERREMSPSQLIVTLLETDIPAPAPAAVAAEA